MSTEAKDTKKRKVASEEITERKLTLFSYWRSSASWRVRIALNLKGLKYEYKAVNLLKSEQGGEEYSKLNPMKQVPTLVIDGKKHVAQSLAIIDYIDRVFTQGTALFPKDDYDRARVWELCEIINSGTQPLQNLPVGAYIKDKFGEKEQQAWLKYWIEKGVTAFETTVKDTAGKYCFGDTITAADLCLVPQLFAARRFGADMSKFPTILRIEKEFAFIQAFVDALPENQPDNPDKQAVSSSSSSASSTTTTTAAVPAATTAATAAASASASAKK